jgi:hypothetical protein
LVPHIDVKQKDTVVWVWGIMGGSLFLWEHAEGATKVKDPMEDPVIKQMGTEFLNKTIDAANAHVEPDEKSKHIHDLKTRGFSRASTIKSFSSAFIQPGDCLMLSSGHRIRHAAMKPSWYPVSVVLVMYQKLLTPIKTKSKSKKTKRGAR